MHGASSTKERRDSVRRFLQICDAVTGDGGGAMGATSKGYRVNNCECT